MPAARDELVVADDEVGIADDEEELAAADDEVGFAEEGEDLGVAEDEVGIAEDEEDLVGAAGVLIGEPVASLKLFVDGENTSRVESAQLYVFGEKQELPHRTKPIGQSKIPKHLY
ncbi:MAG: hypothetical protein M1829_003318 [Trizodia sp. TS-e1964]|nr:MAG: hypothetical protein M1829_003318 [Trizodia sp. TS-e1964]